MNDFTFFKDCNCVSDCSYDEIIALKELSELMYNNFDKNLGKEVDSHE